MEGQDVCTRKAKPLAITSIFNTLFPLDEVDAKRVIVGMSLKNNFTPYVQLEKCGGNCAMSVKETRCSQLMAELMKGMCPSIRSCVLAENLLLDTLPMMLHIIVPNLRPVNTQLFNSREKAELSQVINIMIEYNLNYVQERTPEGSYVYTLDPNIEYLCCYPGMKSTRVLSYGGKQLVAHELELEKLRRAWEKLDITNNAPDSMDTGESEQRASLEPIRTSRSTEGPRKDVKTNKTTDTQLLPNHLQTLVPKVVTPDKVPVSIAPVLFPVV
ncbi:unnamed protein product [Timema podura]|uniref:Uncharacterized protein n=1 Tax=Timema podura TaxID=61482 RepID=A0ABN7NG92_TIMPD|nr:unnamed protein product [Timema podura]